ncbi:hypothetical protein J6T93_02300 [bacterium]|nr:hypothetical protein [bacterium]
MRQFSLICLIVLCAAAPAFADGDAFAEEDTLRALERATAEKEPLAGLKGESLPVIQESEVKELPFFSREETEVPPLEQELEKEEETPVKLSMTPIEAHDEYLQNSRPKWYKRMPWGLMRGFVNVTTCVGELGRGFTYSFGEYHPAIAAPVGLVGGLAGTLGRCGAGLADILTLGLLGDRDLAMNFPDYVWEGQWDYGFYPNGKNETSAPEPETKEAETAPEDLGEGYVPSPTARTPIKGRRIK